MEDYLSDRGRARQRTTLVDSTFAIWLDPLELRAVDPTGTLGPNTEASL